MAAVENAVLSANVVKSLDIEFIQNFKQDADRLSELLDKFDVETVAAGTAIYQYAFTGALNNAAGEGSSSGTAYVEGDEVALSQYGFTKTPIGDVSPIPYRKMTTAKAILKAGYEKAVLDTDKRMLQHIRSQIISNMFTSLANGTGTATSTTFYKTLLKAEATLLDAMETNGDEGGRVVHFLNRQDVYGWIGDQNPVVSNPVFGMEYIENFGGVKDIFVTNKVASGTVIVTPADNIHIYGIDFASLDTAGITYASESNGLVGVHHGGEYGRVSAATDVLVGMLLVPEITDYIVKGTVSA